MEEESKKKEIYTYSAPWTTYSMAWNRSGLPKDRLFTCTYSYVYTNTFTYNIHLHLYVTFMNLHAHKLVSHLFSPDLN